jgi:hypothetical protein
MRVADLLDHALLMSARAAAESWLDGDPGLTRHEPLRAAMHGLRAVFDLD